VRDDCQRDHLWGRWLSEGPPYWGGPSFVGAGPPRAKRRRRLRLVPGSFLGSRAVDPRAVGVALPARWGVPVFTVRRCEGKLEQPRGSSTSAEKRLRVYSIGTLRFLIVEDHAEAREAIRDLLEQSGHEIAEAASLTHALRREEGGPLLVPAVVASSRRSAVRPRLRLSIACSPAL
jgi:hypothetical protein